MLSQMKPFEVWLQRRDSPNLKRVKYTTGSFKMDQEERVMFWFLFRFFFLVYFPFSLEFKITFNSCFGFQPIL